MTGSRRQQELALSFFLTAALAYFFIRISFPHHEMFRSGEIARGIQGDVENPVGSTERRGKVAIEQHASDESFHGGLRFKDADAGKNKANADDHNLSPEQRQCHYRSLAELPPLDRHPKKGTRHMVDPPMGGTVTLVCCKTTAGPLTITARSSWAPLGSGRFLDMVRSNYFSTRVPLMRCVKDFLCQFGIAGDPAADRKFRTSLKDEPNWLPPGPTNRENSQGVKRFARGYMAYAGSGQNSRSNQLIVALKANGPLAGGSPWEVPWGELVGDDSYRTLDAIYTGYGEKGPPQGLLHSEGASAKVKENWPKLDYILSCEIMDEGEG